LFILLRKLLDAGLPEDTVFVKLEGSAGKKFVWKIVVLLLVICRGMERK
jgi:hypothetical protein